MDKRLQDALNEQMNREFESAYIYKAMEVYCAENDYDGSKAWMKHQTNEELEHGEKIREFLHDKGVAVKFRKMEGPTTEYKSLLDVFKASLEHEKFVTNSIREVYELAQELKDLEVQVFLNWFVSEQVEEEATVSAVVSKLEKVGDSVSGIFMLDAVLGNRG